MENNVCPCDCRRCELQPEQHKMRCAIFMAVKQNNIIIEKLTAIQDAQVIQSEGVAVEEQEL